MKTMSLKLWSFCAIVTVGFAATGCAAQASDPTETGADEAISAEQGSSARSVEAADDDAVQHPKSDVPVLGQGPRPGEPVVHGGWSALPGEASPRNPNPCPGQVYPVPQTW